jgi:branched-subunit amino acid aminotransferase/4-amino-4-deoxychorismate lyase
MMAISAQQTKIHVAIATWEWGSYFDPKLKVEGIKLNISNWRRPAPNTIPWDTKASGLYMICTLSKHEAEKEGYTDSLMLDHDGNVAEATGANIFFKDKNGEIHTPIPDSFLDGITRRTVIEIAKSKGIKLNISNWRRPAPNTIPWDTKASGLYMICTLSKHEAEKQGFTDSLMLDHEGNVAEATGANIFFKDKNGDLHTPIPDSFLDGITRRTVIEIAKSKNIKVHERKIAPEELKDFVGCFLTGTAAEVTPVSCIAENKFKVCEMIIDLNESYQALVKKKKAA